MANKIKHRSAIANYLKIKDKYVRLTVGFSEFNEDFSAQTSSKRYIHQKGATTNIVGYEWSSSFSTDLIETEEPVKVIQNIAEKELVGEDCIYDYLIVDLDSFDKSSSTYLKARERKVAIVVDSLEDNDGEMVYSGSFNSVTDWKEGSFNPTSTEFTATV